MHERMSNNLKRAIKSLNDNFDLKLNIDSPSSKDRREAIKIALEYLKVARISQVEDSLKYIENKLDSEYGFPVRCI